MFMQALLKKSIPEAIFPGESQENCFRNIIAKLLSSDNYRDTAFFLCLQNPTHSCCSKHRLLGKKGLHKHDEAYESGHPPGLFLWEKYKRKCVLGYFLTLGNELRWRQLCSGGSYFPGTLGEGSDPFL